MKCDRYEVLYKAGRIANSSLDFPHSCKSLLRLLHQNFSPESLAFYILAPSRRTFSACITSAGPDLIVPCRHPLAETPAAIALQTRKPLQKANLWWFPVYQARQSLGVLHLRAASDQPLPAACQEIFGMVGEELAKLLRIEQLQMRERQRLAQLSFLSEIGLELNRAGVFEDLLQTGLQKALQHSLAACVILRPLYDGAMLGKSFLRLNPNSGEWRELFLAQQEEHARETIAAKQPRFRRLPARLRRKKGIPAEMVFIPLMLDDRVLGVLSFFGHNDANPFPFAPTAGAREFFAAVGSLFASALERIWTREHRERLSLENDRKLRETALLYRTSRAIHSTLHLNELMHLILSATVAAGGGGFERAMLFTINERTETMQGILCVTQANATLVLPPENQSWDQPVVTAEMQQAQRKAPECQKVMKQRLSLDGRNNPLARCVHQGKVLFISHPREENGIGSLVEALQLAPFACAPLVGRERALGVLVVDNPISQEPPSPDQRRFLEMFANHAGTAMENSMLLHRLQTAHQDLRETQARLIHGEKMATLGEMAASISHELRNPLVPIGGFAERLARMAADGSREKEYAQIITREVRRMEDLLANILAFSKKQMLCFGACEIASVIEEAIDMAADSLDRGKIAVTTEFAGDLPVIQCDQQKLRQVLINLITNARQAMSAGGRLVLRASRGTLRGEDAVDVEVEDTGGGISSEVLRNIFNPFFTTKEKGTGLGLSISHRIIEHHRGEIEVKNRERGVVFILRLPANPNFTSQD